MENGIIYLSNSILFLSSDLVQLLSVLQLRQRDSLSSMFLQVIINKICSHFGLIQ